VGELLFSDTTFQEHSPMEAAALASKNSQLFWTLFTIIFVFPKK
jgi:hypothetical protein